MAVGDEILYERNIGGISPLQERYRLNVCNTAIRWKLAELYGNRISGYYTHCVSGILKKEGINSFEVDVLVVKNVIGTVTE